MTRRLRFSVGLAAIAPGLVIAGCGSGSTHHTTHVVSAARDATTHAQLNVVSGATALTVKSAALGAGLYRVSTPKQSGLTPVAHFSHGDLRVSYRGSGGAAKLTIELSESVTWNLRFAGGASTLDVDLGTGKLSGIELAAGNARGTLTLPHPSGTVAITEDGGLSRLTLRVPGDVPTRLEINGGAAHVALDGVTHTGVAGGSVLSSPGYAAAHDRYDLAAKGGISSLLVQTAPG